MRRISAMAVGFLFVVGLVLASSQAKAQTYQCFWPDAGGSVGYVLTNVDNFGTILVFTYNPVGDIFAYTVDPATGPKTVNFGGGGMLPAYFYGQYQGNDPLSQRPIYDFYVSGSGVQGSFSYCCTQVW